MTTKTYAKAPEGCESYFTAGNLYEVNAELGATSSSFYTTDDDGGDRFCLWRDCAHANGDWKRVAAAGEDTQPEAKPTIKVCDRVTAGDRYGGRWRDCIVVKVREDGSLDVISDGMGFGNLEVHEAELIMPDPLPVTEGGTKAVFAGERPTGEDMANKYQREAAYWQERAEAAERNNAVWAEAVDCLLGSLARHATIDQIRDAGLRITVELEQD